MGSATRVPAWADRLYMALLRAYPAPFREEYAGEMRAAFRSRWREERQARGLLGVTRLWIAVLTDTLATALRSQGETLTRDARYAWRSLVGRQSWSFTAAALLTLALGIGAVTAIFTIVHAVLLAPLPYSQPDRVVWLKDVNPSLGIEAFSSSLPNFHSWESARSFSHLAALRGASANLTDGSEPEHVNGLEVSASFWNVLGQKPVAGHAFLAGDDKPGHAAMAMISEGLWKRRYGGDPSLIGRTIDVNLVPHVVVGIAPQDVGFASDVDLWVPLSYDPDNDESRGNRQVIVLGRLAPGVTLQQAQAEMGGMTSRLEREFAESNKGWSLRVIPVRSWIVDAEVAQRLRIILAAVALLLLVAATNVANLQIARAVGRLREMGVRLALGASRARLVRQMLTENLLLAGAGGILGLGLAWFGVRAAAILLPASIPRRANLSLDMPVLLVAGLCVGVTALLAGLLPAGVAVRSSLRDALQRAGRSATAGRSPTRHALVAAQLALATTLVVGAALLTQSLVRLQKVTLGFGDPDHLLTARITRVATTDEAARQIRTFYENLLDEIRALPGVTAAGLISEVPFGPDTTEMPVLPVERFQQISEEGVQANWRIATDGYFRTMQIPLLRGRTFERGRETWGNMILSEGLARRLWPGGEDPIGRRVQLGNRKIYAVIGVVGDVRQLELAQDPTPTMYISTSWLVMPTMTLVVRTNNDPAAIIPSIRKAALRLDPHQPVSDFQTMRSAVAANAAAPRLNTVLVASFAGLALVLAVVGVAGIVGYSVGQRTRELAVRLALGSSPGQAVRHVMRGGLAMCFIGILCGIGAALALGQALSSVLFGVAAHDPLTLIATTVALFTAAALACWLPARRATRISPSLTLREG
ncbi:MAG TPA: ABC transporter permease [Thermoanaerobaculia bacterium]|jgi:putative ABC transport system permease protein|nr:ABC transporter permease [Thermoanaerobaculia bacterium]